jgi:hypothetical protein
MKLRNALVAESEGNRNITIRRQASVVADEKERRHLQICVATLFLILRGR